MQVSATGKIKKKSTLTAGRPDANILCEGSLRI